MDPLSAPSEGAQRPSGNQRHRASTFSTQATPRVNLERVDSSSDPGHGYSNSSLELQTVPIEHLRPFTQGSTTSRIDASRSYADTSSATQSFVSMDSRSGPTDTPHPSTHSVHMIPISSEPDGEEGSTPPGYEPIESGNDDTVRQSVPPAPRSTVHQPNNTPPAPIEKPLPAASHNKPVEALKSSPPEVPVKAEAIPSQKAESPGPVPWINTPQQVAPSTQGQKVSTSWRHESTANARPPRPSDATISPTKHSPPPPEPRKSDINSQRLAATPVVQSPPPKAEPDHSSTNGAVSADAPRPPLPSTVSQMETQYVNMLLALDGIPQLHNILASFFTWILLAGFVLFPGTFTSLQEANGEGLGNLGAAILGSIAHLPLYVVAWICTGIGTIGMCYLWYKWQANYIWLVNRIFMPGLLNSLAGVLSTLASVLGVHHATFSLTSKSTIVVTGGIAVICGFLTGFYTFFLIRNVKKKHDEEVGKQRAGKHGEGFADLSKRKVARLG